MGTNWDQDQGKASFIRRNKIMIEESYTQRMWNDYLKQVKELKERGLTEQEIASSMNSSPLLVENLLKTLNESK